MTEFWESNFSEKQEMWGLDPSKSALIAKNLFVEKGIKNILIPGIGYGRNAVIFTESNIRVTGIEISKTAIELAEKHFGKSLRIHYGSVTDMPFDSDSYDGIFCHALIHLLDRPQRIHLLTYCYNQLAEGGYMVFTAVTKEASIYKQGISIGKDRFELFGGIEMFFYDTETIREEFGQVGLLDITTVAENYPFYLIKCQKTPNLL